MKNLQLLAALVGVVLPACMLETSTGTSPDPAPTAGASQNPPPSNPPPASEPPPPPAAAAPATAPIRCAGQEHVQLNDATIDAGDEAAIQASGQCMVELHRCHLTSRHVAVAASGNAVVQLHDCEVQGGEVALEAHGHGAVHLHHGHVVGGANAEGQAVVEQDGNSLAGDHGHGDHDHGHGHDDHDHGHGGDDDHDDHGHGHGH